MNERERTSLPPLTTQQRELLQIITDTIRTRGWAPTIRECVAAGHWNSPSSVSYQLKILATKGYITRGPGARTIKVADATEATPATEGERR